MVSTLVGSILGGVPLKGEHGRGTTTSVPERGIMRGRGFADGKTNLTGIPGSRGGVRYGKAHREPMVIRRNVFREPRL